jgi:hypothetical protein
MNKPEAVLEYFKAEGDQPHRWRFSAGGNVISGPQENYTDKVHTLEMALRATGTTLRMVGGTITASHPYYAVSIEGFTTRQAINAHKEVMGLK